MLMSNGSHFHTLHTPLVRLRNPVVYSTKYKKLYSDHVHNNRAQEKTRNAASTVIVKLNLIACKTLLCTCDLPDTRYETIHREEL